jgi:RNA polymerase sigma-70 factor (ECF subfamily)
LAKLGRFVSFLVGVERMGRSVVDVETARQTQMVAGVVNAEPSPNTTMDVNPNLSDKARYDYALVLRVTKENDQRAFGELMERYRDSIFHMINKMVFSSDDAEDLTMETFTKAFNRLHQYTPAFAFSTWLFKIGSNHTIDFIRKKRINALSLDQGFRNEDGETMEIHIADDKLDPIQTLEKKERIELLRDVVSKMKPKYRELVELRYFEEKSYDEIAEELDRSLGTVKAQLHRAREALEAMLGQVRETI